MIVFRNFRKIFPHTVVGRGFLVILICVILIQGVLTFAFLNKEWFLISNRLSEGVIGEMKLYLELRNNMDNSINLEELIESNLGISTSIYPDENRSLLKENELNFTWYKKALSNTLEKEFNTNYIIAQNTAQINSLDIGIENNNDLIVFKVPKLRFLTYTVSSYLYWLLGTSIIFLTLGYLLMLSLVRPLVRLSQAADRFGRGLPTKNLNIRGADEMRTAIKNFNMMKHRIESSNKQRTEMLAAVSHDLKAPLTRMKLDLVLFDKKESHDNLAKEIDTLEKMINNYLDFVKSEHTEKINSIDLKSYCLDFIKRNNRGNIKISSKFPNIKIHINFRKNALDRVFSNILANAKRYATQLNISCLIQDNFVELNFDDNGKKISKKNREQVFNPFFQEDRARTPGLNLGSGLGLSICRDIISHHGGSIEVFKLASWRDTSKSIIGCINFKLVLSKLLLRHFV